MSWDSYIDNLIAQTKGPDGQVHCDKACIIGLDGGGHWTTHGHPNALILQGQEGPNIAKCFKSQDSNFFMRIDGQKHFCIRPDDNIIYANCKGAGAFTLQTSKTAIIIAHCPEGGQQGNTNKGVNVIAEYLTSLNM